MITITKRAAEEISLSLHNPDAKDLLMRFAVSKTKNGFEYLLGLDTRKESDIHLKSNEIEYVIAYEQKDMLQGMVVDFDEVSKEEGYCFIFMNPNDPNYHPPASQQAPKKP